MTAPKQVLVVEDDGDVARLVQLLLEAEAFEVSTVGDGHAGLRQFLVTGADIVILDVKLPGMDGWQVCQQIRAVSSVPIILLTACAFPADREKGLALGASAYLCKPFRCDELLHLIQDHLATSGTPCRVAASHLVHRDSYTIPTVMQLSLHAKGAS